MDTAIDRHTRSGCCRYAHTRKLQIRRGRGITGLQGHIIYGPTWPTLTAGIGEELEDDIDGLTLPGCQVNSVNSPGQLIGIIKVNLLTID
ncbi:MAG: hypothetical protein ACK2UR_13540 [Candidatus Promineifilaceae bacterium]